MMSGELSRPDGDFRRKSYEGFLHEHGRGVAQDEAAAYMWYELAAQNGSAGAEERRALLAPTLEPLQLARAAQLEEDWRRRDEGANALAGLTP